jgi:hypothetical protein
MKTIKVFMSVVLSVATLQGYVLLAQGRSRTGTEVRYNFQRDYEKKLAEFSKPKKQLFTSGDPARGYHITDEEHKILNEMKMAESKRIMLENDGTKFDDEYETSQPVENVSPGISTFFNNRHWSFYFDQQWGAYGDPFIRKDEDKKQKAKDFTGHAALGDYNRSMTLEAMPGTNLEWKRDVWFGPANDEVTPWTRGKHLYYAKPNNGGWAQLRIYGAKDAQYRKAHAYGNSRVGAPYNASFMKNDTSLYCSEVVVFAWDAAGINIIPGHWGRNFIWPMNIYDSPKTYAFRGVIN